MAHILVADDNDELRRTIVRMLKAAGHATSEAADGEAAVSICRSDRVEVIMLDVYMPKSDGLETIRALREVVERPKIIMMSGGAHRYRLQDGDLLGYATMLGADAAIRKPFPQADLLGVIADVLDDDRGPLTRYRRLASEPSGKDPRTGGQRR